MKIPQRDEFRHVLRIPTRWSDMDVVGHVNNARYFTYDESSRIEYFSRLFGGTPTWKGQGIILARIACDFIAQLKHPAEVDAAIRVARIGRSSMSTIGGMFVGDACVARTEGVLVWFDYAAQAPSPIPESLRVAIRDHEFVKPEEEIERGSATA
ncbi:MAG: acyl-CoA thioesterase [Panacagrimonas sp.]